MKSDLLKLYRAAIAAVDPYTCVKEHLLLTRDFPHFHQSSAADVSTEIRFGDQSLILRHNLYVAAFGKAALGTILCFEHHQKIACISIILS